MFLPGNVSEVSVVSVCVFFGQNSLEAHFSESGCDTAPLLLSYRLLAAGNALVSHHVALQSSLIADCDPFLYKCPLSSQPVTGVTGRLLPQQASVGATVARTFLRYSLSIT